MLANPPDGLPAAAADAHRGLGRFALTKILDQEAHEVWV